MTIKVGCGKCNSSFAVRDDFAGKSVKCPKCKSPMQVPASTKTAPTAKPPAVAGKTAAGAAGPSRKFNPLLDLLDEAGVCASAASACASGAMEPSHVLAAMGVERERSMGALRLSLGHTTTEEDIDRAAAAVVDAVDRLRAIGSRSKATS